MSRPTRRPATPAPTLPAPPTPADIEADAREAVTAARAALQEALESLGAQAARDLARHAMGKSIEAGLTAFAVRVDLAAAALREREDALAAVRALRSRPN